MIGRGGGSVVLGAADLRMEQGPGRRLRRQGRSEQQDVQGQREGR